jgi:hypothetical protein
VVLHTSDRHVDHAGTRGVFAIDPEPLLDIQLGMRLPLRRPLPSIKNLYQEACRQTAILVAESRRALDGIYVRLRKTGVLIGRALALIALRSRWCEAAQPDTGDNRSGCLVLTFRR